MRSNPDNARHAEKPPGTQEAFPATSVCGRVAASSAPRLRHCVAGRNLLPQEDMIRFVAAPRGINENGHAAPGGVIPDIGGKLPGRGAWVHARPEAVRTALAGGMLAHALSSNRNHRIRGKAKPGGDSDAIENLLMRMETLLAKRAQAMLGLGRRSGAVLGGGGKIRAATTPVAMLLLADDASPREADALIRACGLGGSEKDRVMRGVLTAAELGAVFARPSLAFAAILAMAGGDAAREAVGRLALWRGLVFAETQL